MPKYQIDVTEAAEKDLIAAGAIKRVRVEIPTPLPIRMENPELLFSFLTKTIICI
jgi:hypothetical protein